MNIDAYKLKILSLCKVKLYLPSQVCAIEEKVT